MFVFIELSVILFHFNIWTWIEIAKEFEPNKDVIDFDYNFLYLIQQINFFSFLFFLLLAQQQTQQHLQNQQQLAQQAAKQLTTNPQAHLVQQAIVQQSINTAPWQQAQQQAQQQVTKMNI